MRKSSKRILFRASWRSPSASRSFINGFNLYAYPAGAYFCMRKSRQNALGAVPQDPLTLKLRLDTNDVNIVRTAPQIRSQGACGAFLCEVSASQSQKVTLPRLWVKQAVTCPDGPFPAAGEGEGVRSRAPPEADAARRSTRSGRKNRASEQREDYFGHRKAVGADAAASYLWSASVRSTDLDFSTEKNLNP